MPDNRRRAGPHRPEPTRGTADSGAGGVSPACSELATPNVRGVTDTTVKIGVGLVDIKAFEPVLGEQAAFGDQERHFQIHLDALRKKGVLPICGRDIVPGFRTSTILV